MAAMIDASYARSDPFGRPMPAPLSPVELRRELPRTYHAERVDTSWRLELTHRFASLRLGCRARESGAVVPADARAASPWRRVGADRRRSPIVAPSGRGAGDRAGRNREDRPVATPGSSALLLVRFSFCPKLLGMDLG
jgi:hypothetical protein